jgi:hypothetical protein
VPWTAQERPDSYAASKKQLIFSGCFFEWRLADNNTQEAVCHRQSMTGAIAYLIQYRLTCSNSCHSSRKEIDFQGGVG